MRRYFLLTNLKFKKYLGLDFSLDMLKIEQSKFVNTLSIEFQQKDFTGLDDINEKYDILICTWVLSRLQSPSDLVNRTQKLINKEGSFHYLGKLVRGFFYVENLIHYCIKEVKDD